MRKAEKLETDLYLKKIGRHQFIHVKFYPTHVSKRSIPFGQAVRLKRIISNDNTLIKCLNDLEKFFLTEDINQRNKT